MSGKVREMYGFGDQILMVASDRISAFDVVLPTPIPHKGRVLTGMSLFWFEHFKDVARNHLISAEPKNFPIQAQNDPDLAGRSMVVQRLTMLPIECVVRGYLVGSGWKDYQATGTVCGHALPAGMQEAEKLPKPIFTPATKATDGHDINIDKAAGKILVGDDRFDELERISIELYEAASEYAADPGHHHRRHQVRVRPRQHQPGGAGRRGTHARLVTLLAGRHLQARQLPAVVRQAVRARTGWRRSTGTSSRPAPRYPPTWSPAPRSATSRPTKWSPADRSTHT